MSALAEWSGVGAWIFDLDLTETELAGGAREIYYLG
jgi:hypothetical protein